MSNEGWKVVMIGATGAVGQATAQRLLNDTRLAQLTTLGRRTLDELSGKQSVQHVVDLFAPASYTSLLTGHDTAICTFGVGEPSKISRAEFVKIDKLAVLDFAKACKAAGINHFQLLGSVGTSDKSRSFYLRTKGELVTALAEMGFARLSIFQPSMLMTPNNRYGITQGITLAIWPWLSKLMFGSLKKYRGIKVAELGQAIANNTFKDSKTKMERLFWPDFKQLAQKQ